MPFEEVSSKDGSATTTGTSQDNNEGITVTIQDIPHMDEESKARRRFVTKHRETLDYIQTDGLTNRRYSVPDSRSNHYPKYGMSKAVATLKEDWKKRSGPEWLEIFLPMVKWLKIYEWKTAFLQDVIAGCTVGVMVVPQSMSYAKLAGLPVEYGLYSALMPVFAYSMFGSSRQLAVGPVALISLLLSTGLSHELEKSGINRDNTPNYDEIYNTLSIQVSFLVGLMYIVLGLLRLGFITIFLSHAVISGFTSGAAVIIGMSQLKYIFGYEVERSDVLHELLVHIFSKIKEFNYKTFLVGGASVLMLLTCKNVGKSYPRFKFIRAMGPLAVSVITIVLNVIFDLESKGIPAVGTIPKGLPSVTTNVWFPLENAKNLMLVVFSITIVGFMESIAIGKQLASKHKYEIDSSVELIGLGMSNFVGAIFNAFPVTGSFSRSAVNNESGAQSGISGMVTATIVALVLLFLTPVFEKMPLCVLAAIVISGVLGLLDYEEAIYLWKVHKFDFCVWQVAFIGTMFLGVEIGLAIAVSVSLLLVTYESAYPHTAVLGRLPGTTVYRNIKQYPDAERYDGIVLVRIDAPIYFANTQNIREKIMKYEMKAEDEMAERNGTLKYMVLEFSPVSHIDTSALHILDDILKTYQSRGITMCICNPGVVVMERLVLSGLADSIGRDNIYTSINDCVNACLDQMDNHECSQRGDPPEPGESLMTNEDLNEYTPQPKDIEAGAGKSVALVMGEDDVVEEVGQELVNDETNTGAKVTFSSLGTGQL